MTRSSRTRQLPIALGVLLALTIGSPLLDAQGGAGGGRGAGGGGGRAGGFGAAGQGQGPAQGQGRGARGQGNPRDPQGNTPAGTGSISGIVTLEGKGTGVRHAQVTLTGSELRGQRSVTTTDQGRFTFPALPAGRYNVNVSKPGYVSIAFGAKKPGHQGTPIQLADGQTVDNANIALPRGSVLTGVVVDENGEASPNTTVRAYRYVLRNGEKTLQQAGTDQTDDRGIYRIFQLQPGDYMLSAVPRNQGVSDFTQQIQAQLQPLLQQVQAGGGAAAFLNGAAGGALNNLAGGGRGQQLLDQVQQLQQQLQQQPDQATSYAPVYYPGTTAPGSAGKITLGIGEERSGIDFQLQLVPSAKIQGTVMNAGGASPQGTQLTLQLAGQQDVPSVPGLGTNMTRVNGDGTFTFMNVTPGQYTLSARAPVRDTQPATDAQGNAVGAAGGPGGRAGFGPGGPGARGARGGPGAVTQVLWASADVTIDGRDVTDVTLNLQPGMTIAGRIAFDGKTAQPPTDLTRVRVNLQSLGQNFDFGPPPSAQADASGSFTITGVPPGRYALRGNVGGAVAPPGGGPAPAGGGGGRGGAGLAGAGTGTAGGGSWSLKSVMVNGRDTLDFPLEIKPNEGVSGALLTFTDQSQELDGTLQDSAGHPTSDYTIILFAADNQYWTPQSRRILSARPGTDGKFTLRGMPPGQYRLTAVTDVEPGEWYDPAFLSQLINASMALSIAEGEKKAQDIRLAGGG
jgi:hypothetical protein